METLLKKRLSLTLIALIVFPMSAIGGNERLDNYDRTSGILWWQTWPPWIPGTEGQKEVKIQVLDATTMEPIEGAIVVGGYYGPGVRGGAVCVKSESAISDAEGWATLPNDQDPRVGGRGSFSDLRGPRPETAYKRGYQLAQPPRYAMGGGDNEWFIRETKPRFYGQHGSRDDVISTEKFSDDHKSALMETKERSRIYLMPSMATTKEERAEELNVISRGCSFALPFNFSESEGMFAIWKATYQEKLDSGYTRAFSV